MLAMPPFEASSSVDFLLPGGYELVAEAGRGSFGSVYRARQLSTGQQVAVKVLRTADSGRPSHDGGDRERFRRELRLCAQLSHPNIVRLIDSGETEAGELYTVFEFVEGMTLREVLAEEGKLAPVEAIHLMSQVLDALACAHARGVVHRDIKPDNIMITQTGVRRNAMVLDFGLGGILQAAASVALPRLTASFEMLGTPCYAAPEQLRGESTSARSDLYSWGLVFLECLTGELSIGGASGHEVIMRQLGAEPVPIPSWLRDQRLGRLLQAVTAKAVEKRDVTISGLLDTLASISGGDPLMTAARPERQADRSAERRQLTVVSCGLTLEPTERRELDLDEQDELLHALEATVREVMGGAGGHLASVLGERLLGVFGHPQAREDDARRAAHGALRIVATVRAGNARLESELHVRARVRVGVHTGLVIVREFRGGGDRALSDLLGPTPQVAMRLEERAADGEVIVSGDTQRLLRNVLPTEPAGTLRLSEHSADLPIFRVRARPTGSSRDESVQAAVEIPLVGRGVERAHLFEAWARARDGSPGALLVIGEPGIGKSRLLRELRRVVSPPDWLEGRCSAEYQSSPLRPIAEVLTALNEPLDDLVVRLGLDPGETVPLLNGLLGRPPDSRYRPMPLTPERSKELTLATLASVVIRLAERRPLVLALEDLHWADPTTVELVGLLLEEIDGLRTSSAGAPAHLLLALSARPEFVPPWSAQELAVIRPSRLSRPDVEAMIASVLRERQTAEAQVVDLIVSRSDGVPLFVEEVTHVLAEAGQLFAPPEPLPAGTPAYEVPATLRDLLTARLDPLSSSARQTAQVAAALGREFRYDLLRVVEPSDESRMRDDLRELLDAGLLHARRTARAETYVFRHALVRDAAYESMTRPMRRRVHRMVAHVLRERFPDLADAQPEILAQHFERGDEGAVAAQHWLLAGDRALRRAAYPEAIAQLERGLHVLQTCPQSTATRRTEINILVKLGTVLYSSRGYAVPEVMETFDRARTLCAELGEDLAPEVASGFMSAYITRSERAAVTELLPHFARLADDADIVHAMLGSMILGIEAFWRGDFKSADRHSGRAVELYVLEPFRRYVNEFGQDGGLFSFAYHMLSAWQLGYPERAEAIRQRLMGIAETAPDPHAILLALGFGASLQRDRGDADAALESIDRLTALATDQKLYFWLANAMCNRGSVMLLQGMPDAAVAMLRQGLDVYRSIGVMASYSYYLSTLAAAHLATGDVDAGMATVDEGLAMCDTLLAQFHRPELLRLRGELLLRNGDQSTAESLMRESLVAAERQSGHIMALRAATTLAQLLARTGRHDEARQLLRQTYGWFTEGFDAPDLCAARTLLATLG